MTAKGSPENGDSHIPEDDDARSNVYGPSQEDMDRSWEGYETGEVRNRRGLGGTVWKMVVVGVSLVILVSLTFGILGPLVGGNRTSQPVQPERVTASVLRVIDGRTIVVNAGDGEQTVRLIGIESPLFGDPWYHVAQQVSQSWIEGHEVLLESDERDTDEQGRLFRYVYFDSVMINAALILNGLGKAEAKLPNVRYNSFLADMERRAQQAGAGIWNPAYRDPEVDTESSNIEASLHFNFDAGSTRS